MTIRTPGPVIDCLLARHEALPREPGGGWAAPGGRHLLGQAARLLAGVRESPSRDDAGRWHWGERLHGSVSHCGPWSLTALGTAGPVGVDLQEQRDRPGALAWLGELLGGPGSAPAGILQFAEAEALIKATRLTKESFGQVRLPRWEAGWRRLDEATWLWSDWAAGIGAVAVAATGPLPLRWWFCRCARGGVTAGPRPCPGIPEADTIGGGRA